ncbi:MAG TPA: DegV family protein [Micrococcaceae bacterium]|jgi:DegV family protein with EDD domain|nr:DegV family protein [Micrococcaceae bacterium]
MPEREPAGILWLRGQLARFRPAAPAVERPPSVAVVTDSAAALPPAWVQGLPDDGRLTIVPMPVMVGEEIYGEGVDELGQSIAVALAAGKPVRTSRPSPGQFERAYRSLMDRGYSGAVSVHISGALSGTVESAQLAASRLDFPIDVVDSRTAGMAQGFGVQGALLAAAAGGGPAAVAAAARDQAAAARIYFYVPSLEQLRRGGRIGTAASWLGTVLAIKPILSIRDGQVVPLERIRTAPKAVARLEELVRRDIAERPDGTARLAIHHFGNEAAARELSERLRQAIPVGMEVYLTGLPAVLAAHAGLGVLAVIVGDNRFPPAAIS